MFVSQSSGVEIFNISDPYNLIAIGTYNHGLFGGPAQEIIFHEGSLFLADNNNGLMILNISDPTDPKK